MGEINPMPTLRLTESQSAAVQEILDTQSVGRIGYIAVLNHGFDRATGQKTVELEFVGLPWPDASRICRQVRKLASGQNS